MADRTDLIATSQGATVTEQIRVLGKQLGFQAVHFSAPDTNRYRPDYEAWLAQKLHGEMSWLAHRLDKRFDGRALQPDTKTVITVRMDYWPAKDNSNAVLNDPDKAYISRYALGRDYHKVLRKRLTTFGKQISELAGEHGYRACVDSAPVMERQLAEQSGMGWIGKNTLLLSAGQGSYFFLGELFTSLQLDVDPPLPKGHCGSCSQCLVDCPTDAFIGPGVLDARRCISYLTIEYKGSIPPELRPLMGNRIYGCDDCQLVCPHNRQASATQEPDFSPRHRLDNIRLLELFAWDETTFLANTEGSAIRRIGYAQWIRNIAVAIGNGQPSAAARAALLAKLGQLNVMVDEHIRWALTRLEKAIK